MEKMLKIYKDFWMDRVDTKNKTSRNDFWVALWWNVIILILIIGFIMGYKKKFGAWFGIFVLLIYTIALIVPTITLFIRRYNDAGLSKYWVIITIFLPIVLFILNAIWMKTLAVQVMAWILLGINFIICMFPKDAFKHTVKH